MRFLPTLLCTILASGSVAASDVALPLPPRAFGAVPAPASSPSSLRTVFLMNAEFPAAPGIDYYSDALAKLGWHRCAGAWTDWQPVSQEVLGESTTFMIRNAVWAKTGGSLVAVVGVRVEIPGGEADSAGTMLTQRYTLLALPIKDFEGTAMGQRIGSCQSP